MKTVAILCAARKSAYRDIPGVEIYDEVRDCRNFPGGMPVIAHPPCRSWSAFTAHQAKPMPGERDIGLWCCEQVKRWGGIIEQPAHSRLWQAASLPLPGSPQSRDSFSLAVWQAWWGYSMKKGTWLYFRGIDCTQIEIPFRLHVGNDHRREQVMSHRQRAETLPRFAEWLVALARDAVLREELLTSPGGES